MLSLGLLCRRHGPQIAGTLGLRISSAANPERVAVSRIGSVLKRRLGVRRFVVLVAAAQLIALVVTEIGMALPTMSGYPSKSGEFRFRIRLKRYGSQVSHRLALRILILWSCCWVTTYMHRATVRLAHW